MKKDGGLIYCPHCAERLAPGTAVCPMCRAPLPAPSDLPEGPAAPVLRNILPPLFCVLVILSLVVLPGIPVTATGRFLAWHLSFLPEVSDAGDVIISASCADPALSDYLRGSSLALKYRTGRGGTVLNACVTLMESPVLTAALTWDFPTVGIAIPQLADKYYTADLPAFMDNLGLRAPEEISSPAPTVAQITSIVRRYFSIAFSVVKSEDLEVKRDVRVTLASSGEEITADLYTYKPSPQALRSALRRVSDELDRDGDMLDLFTYAAELFGSGIPARDARRGLYDLSEYIYEHADTWSEALETPLTWTLAVEDGRARFVTFTRGGITLALELEPGEPYTLAVTCRDPDLPMLEGITVFIRLVPDDTAKAPTLPREEITDYSVLQLLGLAKELRDNVGEDILDIIDDIVDLLGI